MAEDLKDQYGEHVPRNIAEMLKAVYPEFKKQRFVDDCLTGYEDLELTARARHICQQMAKHLPSDFSISHDILLRSLGEPLESSDEFGMAPFIYLPHVFFAAEYGLKHFDAAMLLQYELTQRFTAEFSIRAYIQAHPEKTMLTLQRWCEDPSEHVRRLVSEGTRPRLPWASRLPDFQKDPTPVIALLDLLKDDPSLYVRRSVANNLNDIYKDNPEAVLACTEQWAESADQNRLWLINHALRSAVKAGDDKALRILGFGTPSDIHIENLALSPNPVKIGDTITINFDLINRSTNTQALMVDAKVYFIKANGQASAKIFKLKKVTLAPN